ncbi:uncharacterized protein LOC124638040 isoform X3 [Helicoverpa zea]|uniref:uncharacterized protein LOC124638040 isoform X3 n=1 Tax=Helicoverpa zea TaxID=7113 RepID=UPI001F5879A3|nr:uncharacterized protein LOC124638040 isoform X3 [Helicoverpa zea]XP_049701168.1 uncharacterized protein LOC110376299 isoform X1 [Helicoverpa armigera]
MQAAPARYVSVSELYSTDEVELLLDEIRELEPTSCRGEDVQVWDQDFEIAGSGCGAGAGGRSPAGTELTERSWDSHAQYRRAPPPRPRALAPLYCRLRHLLTARGAASLLLVLCSLGACACVWAGVGLRVGRVPLAPRVRLLLLAALSSLLLHSALLVLHVTRLAALLPLDWNKLGAWTSAWSAASLAAGGALTLHAVLAAPEYRWAPAHLAHLLCSAATLGLGGACAAAGMALGGARRGQYRAVPAAPAPVSDDPL